MNQFRLDKLKARIECVEQVFSETKNQLVNRIKNKPEDYKNVLTNLLVQGFIKLLEENINVVCKKEDYEVVKTLIEPAKEKFLNLLKNESKKFKNFTLNVTLDTKYYLPSEMYYDL